MTEQTQGKGRPTPKRNQKARGPVAPPPTNRREAAKQLRAKQAEGRAAMRAGIKAGDEKTFLARDRGPVRAWVRDHVDGRRSIGTLLMPYLLITIVIGFTGNNGLYASAFLGMLALMAATAVDFLLLGRSIRHGIKTQFPDEQKLRGHVFYGLQRTSLIRKWRTPPARV